MISRKNIRRGALAFAAFVTLLTGQLPAAWLAQGIVAASRGNLLLTESQGTVWSGAGVLWSKDASARTGRPLSKLNWHFEPVGLFALELRWRLHSGDSSIGTVYLSGNKFGVRNLQAQIPATVAAGLNSGAIAKFGWRGDLAITVPNWECRRQNQQCSGNATLLWQGAASDLLPIRELGDYLVTAKADGNNVDVQWNTLRGEIQTRGQAQFSGRTVQLNGTIAGNPEWLGKLPNIAQGWVQAGQKPGEYAIAVNIDDTQESH